MKKFVEPRMDVEILMVEDVITTSIESNPNCGNESDPDRG